MAIDIVGSKLHAETGYGDTSSLQSSSIRKGEKIQRSKIAQSIIASDPVTAGAGNWQTRDVNAKQIAASPTMHSPDKAGDKVPSKVLR